MVQTFKAFAEVADFNTVGNPMKASKDADKPHTEERVSLTEKPSVRASTAPSVAINIQLQVPPDPTGEIYDKFFAAMAKHLPMSSNAG